MIRIETKAWRELVAHSERFYPNLACGVMFGFIDNEFKLVTVIKEATNVARAPRKEYAIEFSQLEEFEEYAAQSGTEIIGFYHSNPDCDGYFSESDLKNSVAWFSYVVLSIQSGRFDHANSWVPSADHSYATKEELIYRGTDDEARRNGRFPIRE